MVERPTRADGPAILDLGRCGSGRLVPLPRVLFRSPLNSGLCISETLDLKITDGRLVEGAAKSARVIGKGDQERIMPLPRKSEVLFEIRKDLEK